MRKKSGCSDRQACAALQELKTFFIAQTEKFHKNKNRINNMKNQVKALLRYAWLQKNRFATASAAAGRCFVARVKNGLSAFLSLAGAALKRLITCFAAICRWIPRISRRVIFAALAFMLAVSLFTAIKVYAY